MTNMFQVTNIIYLYLLITICLIFFNVWYVLYEKISIKIGEKKKEQYLKIIKNEDENEEISEKRLKYFYHQLKNVNNFIWFDSVLDDIRKDEESEIDVDKFILKLNSVFQKLASYYRKEDSVQKAFFAHVLTNYPNISDNKSDQIYKAITEFTYDDSIYCRENAMLYLFNNGTVDNIIHALINMNNRNLFYNQKMLTDDLLKFKGDKQKLAERLLELFDEFIVETQIAIINFLRLLKNGYEEKIYELYTQHKYDKEVELAMIRYFARHIYPPILTEFEKTIKDKSVDNDEYRIILASTLASYDEKEVRQLLIEALSDTNWYVRKNSATSLARMKITDNELKEILESNDRYAKEMVSYIWKDLGKEYTPTLDKESNKKGKKKHV